MIDPTLTDKHVRELGELRELIGILKDNLRQANDEMARNKTEIEKATDEINRAAIREGALHTEIERLRAELDKLNDVIRQHRADATRAAFEEAAKIADTMALEVDDGSSDRRLICDNIAIRIRAKAKEVQGDAENQI